MDGVPGVTQVSCQTTMNRVSQSNKTQYPIAPGGNFTYRFSVGTEYGFYWYHSHFRAYYDDAIRGPLMIHPSTTHPRPFEKLAKSDSDLTKLLQTEHDALPILLNDWTHDTSDTIYAQYFKTGAFPNCVDSLLANGLGRVECLSENILQAGTGLGLNSSPSMTNASSTMSTGTSSTSMMGMSKTGMSMMGTSMTGMSKRMDMSGSSMPTDTMTMDMSVAEESMQMTSSSTGLSTSMISMAPMPSMASMSSSQDMGPLNAQGCTPPMMFKPGFNINSLPPATCANTTSPMLTIPANSTQGWLALNLVNSGAVSGLAVSLDAHSMFIYAADGLYVTLQEVKVS